MKREELEFILEEGENYRIEFKERLNNSVIKEMCAFANSSGGTVLLGFDDRVEISDPGGLPPTMKLEDLGTRSVLRNPNIANLLLRIDYIEQMGTGIKRIAELCKENGTPTPEYKITGFFTIIFKRELITSLRTDQVAAQVTDQVTDQVKRLLSCLLKAPLPRNSIMEQLELKHRKNFSEHYIKPAIESGLIEMTEPDSPKSPTQKYRLTQKGKELL